MPNAWSRKDERKYEHVKESAEQRGMPAERAEELAGRTVNKGRRQAGRTPSRATQGTGNPRHSLDARTKEELYNLAKERGIEGRSTMRKDELIRALRRH